MTYLCDMKSSEFSNVKENLAQTELSRYNMVDAPDSILSVMH